MLSIFFFFFYAHKAQVAGREGSSFFFGLAYAPACVAVWCAKASLVPVCAYVCVGMQFLDFYML